jgi:galactitol-specific phosphotransferase system IIB component
MRKYAALFLLYFVSSCAQLGLETPQTPDQKVAAGYATAAAINQSATALLNAKKISSDDAQHVLDSTRSARSGLDIARTMTKVDPKGADAKIAAQIAILNALNAYLASKGR